VETVYNGVDLDEIDGTAAGVLPDRLGFGAGAPVVVCVANIRPIKGIDTLVRTAARVTAVMPDARFLVIGAVQDTAYFRAVGGLARSLNVADKVVFFGPSRDVVSLLKACSVFYLSSRSEGLSNAMLEAMAAGLPCVATDVGGNRELIEEGRSGFLIPADDPVSAAERILAVLRNPSLARQMGQSARRLVKTRYSVKAMMARLDALYDGLLGREEPASPPSESEDVPSAIRHVLR
jgi:glycosyltransferase involved in cell wall biosynthesis